MMRYHIHHGTEISRYSSTNSLSGASMMRTTKSVDFDEFDLMDTTYVEMEDFPGVPDKTNPKVYTFRLPPEAAPYVHIKVDARNVLLLVEENDNENN